MTNINLGVDFAVETCCYANCGIIWAMPVDFKAQRKKDHKTFCCPNGHGQHYTQLSNEEKLKRDLAYCRERRDQERERAQRFERSRRSYMGHVTRLKNAAKKEEQSDE